MALLCGAAAAVLGMVDVGLAEAKSIREEIMGLKTDHLLPLIAVLIAVAGNPATAQKRYDPGASDTKIKIGNIVPYSGPASAYGTNGKTIAAYFNKVNAEGGINGRRINFVTYDDAYNPPKTVEQARKLLENPQVLLTFSHPRTP